MNLAIRLTWQHDPDLIGLRMHPDFDLAKAIKEVLCAYTKGEYFTIKLPGSLPPGTEIKNCTIHISLGEKSDADVIKKILEVKSGFRNTAVKNIFRTYLENIYLYPIHSDSDTKIANRVSKKRVAESRKPDDMSSAAKEAEEKRIEIKKSEKVSFDKKQDLKTEATRQGDEKSQREQIPPVRKTPDKFKQQSRPDNPPKGKPKTETVKPRTEPVKPKAEEAPTDDFDLFGAIGKIGG